MTALVNSDEIVRALVNGEPRFLNNPPAHAEQIPEDPADLIYDRIFPWRKISAAQLTTKSYITMEFETPNINRNNNIFKDAFVHIYIFSHHQLLRTAYGGSRPDMLLGFVDDLLNESRDFGFGMLQLQSCRPVDPSDDHQGYVLTYKAIDRNNSRCGDRR
jgi:hypothetical protein